MTVIVPVFLMILALALGSLAVSPPVIPGDCFPLALTFAWLNPKCKGEPDLPGFPIIANECIDLDGIKVHLPVPGLKRRITVASVKVACGPGRWNGIYYFPRRYCTGRKYAMRARKMANTCMRVGGVLSYRLRCLPEKEPQCRPQYGLNEIECTRRITYCKDFGARLKWTGPGCKSDDDKRLGDGGCQCVGYCGYSCKEACNSDPRNECQWDGSAGVCLVKGTGLPGVPIEKCEFNLFGEGGLGGRSAIQQGPGLFLYNLAVNGNPPKNVSSGNP